MEALLTLSMMEAKMVEMTLVEAEIKNTMIVVINPISEKILRILL